MLAADVSLFKLTDENAVVSTHLNPLCYLHPQQLCDGTNKLIWAYQGTTVISVFQSLTHIGWVEATEGLVSHNLTKKVRERDEELAVGGGESVLERGPKARGW